MNIADLYNKINGLSLTPKCNDLYALLGAVKAKEYSCPNCDEQWDGYDEEPYDVNEEQYPKIYNENRGSTIDGNYWDWDEVHRCKKCETIYWFRNGGY